MKILKSILLTLLMSLVSISAFACDVCQKQQPKILKGISHGAGPQNNLDWIIVILIFIVTIITLFMTIKYLALPGEKDKEHIKRTILN